jgi:hypothetical protein
MSQAKIVRGVWTRKAPEKWQKNGEWRTAIYKSVLSDRRLRTCRYVLEGGPVVLISVEEMKRAVEGGPDYSDGAIWGPFNIDPRRKTVAGVQVKMLEE